MSLRPALSRIVDTFSWGRVLVVGDVLLDEWLHGSSGTLAREAAVPAVRVQYNEAVPGGAANAAANVAALSGRVHLVGVVGDDPAARRLREQLDRRGVQSSLIAVPGRRTVAKRRLMAGHQVLARFDEGDLQPVPQHVDDALAGRIAALARQVDVVLVADYGAGTCSGPAVRAALAALPVPLVVDAHDVRSWRDCAPAAVTPNWAETRTILDLDADVTGPERIRRLRAEGDVLLAATGSRSVVATVDGDGAVLVTTDTAVHVPTRRVDDPHSAGAGDTLAAALALGLAVKAPMTDALEVAVAAATVVVQRPGTATCSRADLVDDPGAALLTGERLVEVCREHRAAGRRIAFTNGCFDVLHAGHVACLKEAAEQADVVVVALNSDAGVRDIKGPGRPVNAVHDRAAVLCALGTVDHVVAFEGVAPLALIEAIRPDVYVKGTDHDVHRLPEAQAVRRFGGRIHPVRLLADHSTSGVIAACAAVREATA